MDCSTLITDERDDVTTVAVSRPSGVLGQRVTRLVEEVPCPVVAWVDGYVLGGGCEVAPACDFAREGTSAFLAKRPPAFRRATSLDTTFPDDTREPLLHD